MTRLERAAKAAHRVFIEQRHIFVKWEDLKDYDKKQWCDIIRESVYALLFEE